jgi:hypothetical protein
MPSSLANVGNIQDYNKPQTIVPMTKDYVTQTPMERAQTEAVQTSTQEKQIDMARKQKYIETYNNLPDDMPVTEKFNALSKVDPDQANIYLQWAGKNELDQATAKHANLKAQNEMIAGILDNLRTKYPTPESRKSPEFRAAYTTAYNFAKNTELGPLNMTPPDAGLESSPEIKGLYAKVLNGELTPDEGKKRIEYEVKRRSMYATMPATENFDEQTDAFKSAAISAEKQIEQKLAEANASGNMPPTTVGAGNRVLPTEVKRHNIAMEDILRQKAEKATSYDLTEEQLTDLNTAIENGLDPAMVNSRTAKVFADLERKDPGKYWNTYRTKAAYERSAGAMNTKSLLNSIDPLFTQLDEAGKKLSNTPFPGINRLKNFWAEQTGDPDIVAFNNLRTDLVQEVERALTQVGVQSDTKINRAIKNISSAASYPQLKAAIANTKIVMSARLKAVKEGPTHGQPMRVGEEPKEETETRPASGAIKTKSGNSFKVVK